MRLKFFEYSKFLWWFAGEDPFILKNCNKTVRVKFSLIGILVITVMITTFISISYGLYKLLESYYVGLLIGFYTAVLVMFLYMFILYTVTKDVLPHKKGKSIEIFTSYIIRFGFLFALGLVVSQPIEYMLFSDEVNKLMNGKIIESIKEKNKSLNIEYSMKVKELEELNISNNDLKNEIIRFQEDKDLTLQQFMDYQYSRNFFIEKMILMDKHLIYIWFFSAVFIILFSLPVFFKIKIDFNTNYYKNKRIIQRDLLEWHYDKFLESYNAIIKEKFPSFTLTYKSPYADPPYNTQKISKPQLASESEFSKWLLNEGN